MVRYATRTIYLALRTRNKFYVYSDIGLHIRAYIGYFLFIFFVHNLAKKLSDYISPKSEPQPLYP